MTGHFVAPFDTLETRELGDEAHLLLRPLVFDSTTLYAYRLTLPEAAREGWNHMLTVPEGFVTDFMSVPRWLPIAFSLIGGHARRAGVIHDFLYQTHLVSRAAADDVLPEAMRACAQAEWRGWQAWVGVRIGGRRAYRTGPLRKEVLALSAVIDPMGEV